MNWRVLAIVALIFFLLGIGADEGWRHWQETHRPVPKQVAQSITTKEITADKWAADKETFTAKDSKGNVIGTVTVEDRERIDTLNAASGVVKKERRRTVTIDVKPPTKDNMLGFDYDILRGAYELAYMRRFEVFGLELWGNTELGYRPSTVAQVPGEVSGEIGIRYAFNFPWEK